jgi:hypothetical protein
VENYLKGREPKRKEDSMEDKIYEAIEGWAGIFTWHTSHPLDSRRFHAAMTTLYRDVGPDVSEGDFRRALQKHNKNNIEGLGGKGSEEDIEEFTKKAMIILAYLKDEGKR